ncbi:unnamed protein product [Schistosoma bovis]|nr:unnamed protein product [Schistosoma bovis]
MVYQVQRLIFRTKCSQNCTKFLSLKLKDSIILIRHFLKVKYRSKPLHFLVLCTTFKFYVNDSKNNHKTISDLFPFNYE